MRVAIDATALGSHRGGDETLVRSLLRGLAGAVHESDAVEVLTSAGAQLPAECRAMAGADLRVTAIERRSGPRHFALDLPAWLRRLTQERRRPDLVVCLTHAPVWSPAPVALLVTDLSFIHDPGGYPADDRWRLRLLVGSQVRRAAQVLTISDFCRTDLEQTYRLAAGSVQVLPLVVDAPAPPDPAARTALASRGVPSATCSIWAICTHARTSPARSRHSWTCAVGSPSSPDTPSSSPAGPGSPALRSGRRPAMPRPAR